MKLLHTIFLLLFLLPFQGNAQLQINGDWLQGDSSLTQVLTTVRGDEFVGRLLQHDTAKVHFKLDIGDTLNFGIGEVRMVEVLPTPIGKPQLKHRNISERLLASPTGFGLAKGESEYRNVMFLYNAYHHGITDKISLGGGIMPLFISYLGWVDAKFSFELGKNVHIGTGGLLGGGVVFDFSEDEGGGGWNTYGFTGGFGALTIGNSDKFINLSMARIVVSESGEPNSSPWMYSLGGSYKIRRNKRLFVEAGNIAGTPDEWTIFLGLTTSYKGNCFDAGLIFFPRQRPRMLPAFAYAFRFYR